MDIRTTASPRDFHAPNDREAADDRGRRVQAHARPAVHLSAERPRLHRKHAAHVLRGAVRGVQPSTRCLAGARPAVHPARGPRAEREHLDGAARRQHRRNPYAAMSAGVSALWGPAHGGANEAVLDMLEKIGTRRNIPKFLGSVKDSKGDMRLMGFGHRVYKNFDPRAKIIREMCHKVLGKLGPERQPAVRAGAAGSRKSRSRTITSSAASSIRTSISTPASSTARSASRARCSP